MRCRTESFALRTSGQGLYEITDAVTSLVHQHTNGAGLATVFVKHTSASIIIQENADPSAKYDLEQWLRRLVREDDPHFTHTFEGADDMPAHIKSALTATSVGIPIVHGRLGLGTWQGIYLWEHRDRPHNRSVLISLLSEE